MSDRYCGTIEILKSDIRRYPELAEAVKEEFYTLPVGTPLDVDNHIPDDDDNWVKNLPIACFKDEEACYGYFENIENICKSLHVPFDRWSAAAYEFREETVYSRPDINNGTEIVCNGYGEREFTESKLRKLIVYNAVVLDDLTGPTVNIKATGQKFIDFLNSLPKVRPLEDYEGYVHPVRNSEADSHES